MTNNKKKGGTRRKKGGSYEAMMSKMQGHLDRGIAAASAEVKKRGASLMPKLDTLRGHVSDVKTKLSAAKEEAHAQVGNALVRAHAYAHASGFGPSVMSHFNKAKTLARGFGSMRKGSFFRKGGYGSSKKKPSGGTKKKCGQRGGYGSSRRSLAVALRRSAVAIRDVVILRSVATSVEALERAVVAIARNAACK